MKRLIIVLFFLINQVFAQDGFYSLAGNEHSAGKTMAEKFIERALRKQKEGDKEGAIADFEYAKQLDAGLAKQYEEKIRPGKSAKDWYNRAKKSIFDNEKIACYEKAVAINAEFIKAWEKLAKLYIKQKRYEDAVLVYKKLIILKPEKKSYMKKLNKYQEEADKKNS